MSAMVRIFSWGERLNVLFNKAKPSSLFVLYNIKKYICYHLECLNILYYTQFCFDLAISGQRSPQRYIQRWIVLFNGYIQRWRHNSFEWSIYFISRDRVSSNQMTTIYIGVI